MVQLSPLLLILLPTISYADPLHLPLLRRAPVTQNMDYYDAMANHLRGKYGFSKPPSKRATSANVNLTNQQIDASYFATVNIGTPSQPFDIILDTGSADLWVADTSCSGSCPTSAQLFDPTKSSTFKGSSSGTTISYGSGQVSGQLAQDVVSMGGFNVSSQGFLAADTLSTGLLSGSVAGIMGLGFQSIAATGAKPFWQTLADGNQLSSSEMSFFITRFRGNASATTLEPGGTFTLGGTDSTLFSGSIEFLNLATTASFWLLKLASVTVQGKSVSITTGNSALSAIDTGTTLIGGPTNDVQAIWAAAGGQAIQSTPGFYSFPCSATVNVTMSFGGQSWPIDPRDMNLGPVSTGSSQCLGAVFDLSLGSNIPSGGTNPSWVIGATFLKNVYSVFRSNPASVGFAQLSTLAGGSGTATAAPGSTSTSTSSAKNKAAAPAILSLSATLLTAFLL